MSWTYSTNFMGPTGIWWYEKYNIPYTVLTINSMFTDYKDVEYKEYQQYAGGRIDCYCNNPDDPDYDHYNQELYLPIMTAKSFNELSLWLETYKTDRLDIDVLKTYESSTGNRLEVHNSEH